MSKEHKRGLPSDGELTDDELEISGGAGGDASPKMPGQASLLAKAPATLAVIL